MARDLLAPKRRHLVDLIVTLNVSRLEAIRANPLLDLDPTNFERTTDRGRLERGVANMLEQQLDELIAFHDRNIGGPRFVWLPNSSDG
jgi:hypothetical protein